MSSNTNFATFNPLSCQEGNGAQGTAADDLTDGNTNFNVTNGSSGMAITIATPATGGKWYCEFYLAGSVGNYAWVGYYPVQETPETKKQWAPSGNTTWVDTGIVSVHSMGRYFYTENQYTDSGATSFTAGDIISIALDLDNGATYFAKNNTFMNSGNPASGASKTGEAPTEGAHGKEYLLAVGSAGSSGHNWTINAGQDSSFGGQKSTGTASAVDANGYGDFYYSPPSGYLALCSANVPVSSDIDPAGDDGATENPTKQFNCITYTGNASTNAITGLGFQPDLCWIKKRNSTGGAALVNSTIGGQKVLQSNNTDAEGSSSPFQSFDSDGFTLDNTSSYLGNFNGNTDTYVAWCWKANGGTTSTNTDGTIATTLQVGKGFSIGTYTGTGSNATVGHGLGAVPDFTIFRERGTSGNWVVTSQKNMSSNDHNLYLQLSNSQSDGNYFQNTAMTSTVISIGTHADINGSTNTYVMYNWINVDGYQKFGSYIGNAAADGTFVYTGFRPRMIFVKSLGSSDDWIVIDTARSTSNVTNKGLSWNTTDSETTSNRECDILSNGFKPRTSNTNLNKTATTYLYGAWGDVPFKYNNSL